MVSVGIVGGSGFTGAELLRLCAGHPEFEVVVATGDTQAGTAVGALYPSLLAAYPHLVFTAYSPDVVRDVDLVFCGLPHGASQRVIPELRTTIKHVVDLAADFRLKTPETYERWYRETHDAPELLSEFVYGLPELHRDELRDAALIAAPGCYPTATILALAPFLRAGAVERHGIIVDAASGVSGAGRDKYPFCGTDEDFVAYGLLDHRHTAEMEQSLDAQVLFTPHLAPMNRGILATCYSRPISPMTTDDALALLRDAYDNEPFVVVTDAPPSTKATLGSNTAHVTARVDPRTGWLVSLCAIDNLVKGASGQALQCANLSMGIDETLGLPTVGVYP